MVSSRVDSRSNGEGDERERGRRPSFSKKKGAQTPEALLSTQNSTTRQGLSRRADSLVGERDAEKKRGGGRDEPAWAAGRAASARTERRASVLRAGRAEWDDTMVFSSGGEGEMNEEGRKERKRKEEGRGKRRRGRG